MSWVGPFTVVRAYEAVLVHANLHFGFASEPDTATRVVLDWDWIDSIARHTPTPGREPTGSFTPFQSVVEMMCRTVAEPALSAPHLKHETLVKIRVLAGARLAQYQATLRLQAIPNEAMEGDRLDSIANAVANGSNPRQEISHWVKRWLRPMAHQFGQLGLFDQDAKPKPPQRAYLGGRLTNVTRHQALLQLGRLELLSLHLAQWGIESYIPALHTSPMFARDMPPSTIHAVDYNQVISSDLVVLDGAPSLGAGEELAWASRSGAVVILFTPDDSQQVSRLAAGSTGIIHELPLCDEPTDFAEHVDPILIRYQQVMSTHAEQRANGQDIFASILGQLRVALSRSLESIRLDPTTQITERRAREIVISPTHVGQASVAEMIELERHSGVAIIDTVRSGSAPTNSPLTDEEFEALRGAAELLNITGVRVAELAAAAQGGGATNGNQRARRRFSNVEAWVRLNDRL